MASPGEVGIDAVTDGAVVAGRYRLTELLARGGMGEVHDGFERLRPALLDEVSAILTAGATP